MGFGGGRYPGWSLCNVSIDFGAVDFRGMSFKTDAHIARTFVHVVGGVLRTLVLLPVGRPLVKNMLLCSPRKGRNPESALSGQFKPKFIYKHLESGWARGLLSLQSYFIIDTGHWAHCGRRRLA